jgi:hypothetical protein
MWTEEEEEEEGGNGEQLHLPCDELAILLHHHKLGGGPNRVGVNRIRINQTTVKGHGLVEHALGPVGSVGVHAGAVEEISTLVYTTALPILSVATVVHTTPSLEATTVSASRFATCLRPCAHINRSQNILSSRSTKEEGETGTDCHTIITD